MEYKIVSGTWLSRRFKALQVTGRELQRRGFPIQRLLGLRLIAPVNDGDATDAGAIKGGQNPAVASTGAAPRPTPINPRNERKK